MSFNEKIILNDGRQMPLLGLGVYKAVGENEVEQAIADAADAGYRLIDTASVYKNEDGVGRGIKALTIPREELFVTTKIWNTAQESATWKILSTEVWSAWDLIMWIYI